MGEVKAFEDAMQRERKADWEEWNRQLACDVENGKQEDPWKCDRCNGVGKISSGSCNCGSGEGCDVHDENALHLFGIKCPKCKGTGKAP